MNKRLIPIFATLSIAFSTVFLINVASAVSKPTSICKKIGQTTIINGYRFTCVKSGKKIVWNSGVKVVVPKVAISPTPSTSPTSVQTNTPTPTPTSTPTSTSTSTPTVSSVPLPKEGSSCTDINKRIDSATGFMRCDWQGGYTTAWRFHVIQKLSTSKDNSYTNTPKSDESCKQSGDTFDLANGYLECRYTHGGLLKWVQINTAKKSFTNLTSPSGVELCKLQNSAVPAKTGRSSGQTAGFPSIARDTFINPGVNEAIVVGVDFPELRGNDSDLSAINAYDKKMLNDWYSYFSNGKVSFNLSTYDHWIHLPNSAKSYSITGTFDQTANDSNQTLGNLAQKFIDYITKEVDLSKYKTVYMIFPDGEYTLDTDLIVRNHAFTTNQGIRNLNFFGWGKDMEYMVSLHWAFFVHESLHDAVLIGHAPGNGWPFSIMTNQSGISLSPFSWEQFLLGWLPDNQIYCTSKEALSKVQISLTPMEREDKQTKSAIIKISDTEAIVVEAHGIEKWSDFKTNSRAFPAGFYGVMAYLIDLNQAGAPPVAADGRSIQDDTGNSTTYPRWAYWQPVDGRSSAHWNWDFRTSTSNYNDFVAVLGDSFTIKGVKIQLVGTGDYETIEISKA